MKRFGSPIPPERQIDLGLLDEYARDPKVATTVRLLAIYVVYWSSNNHQNFLDHVHHLVEQSAISIGAADAIIAPRTVANTLNMLAEWLGDDSFFHRESSPAQTGCSASEDNSEMTSRTSQTNLCVAPNPCAGQTARAQRAVVTHGAFALGGISLGVLLTLLAMLSPLRDKFSPQRMPPAPQSSTR